MARPSFLSVEALDLSPLAPQPGVPFWDRQWIDPALFELLFTHPSEHTYLVVDATLRCNITKVFDLDSLDVPVRCLFQGEAADRFAVSAPYLINLTLADRNIPKFHKTFFADHWDKGTGIVLRSDAPMDAIWRHLRKFTKSHSEVGPDQFFRFWETNTARDYFEAVSNVPSRAKDFFQIKSGGWISLFVSHSEIVGRAHKIHPHIELLERETYSQGPFCISDIEETALLKGVLRGYATAIKKTIPREVFYRSQLDHEEVILQVVLRMHRGGCRSIDQITAEVIKTLRCP